MKKKTGFFGKIFKRKPQEEQINTNDANVTVDEAPEQSQDVALQHNSPIDSASENQNDLTVENNASNAELQENSTQHEKPYDHSAKDAHETSAKLEDAINQPENLDAASNDNVVLDKTTNTVEYGETDTTANKEDYAAQDSEINSTLTDDVLNSVSGSPEDDNNTVNIAEVNQAEELIKPVSSVEDQENSVEPLPEKSDTIAQTVEQVETLETPKEQLESSKEQSKAPEEQLVDINKQLNSSAEQLDATNPEVLENSINAAESQKQEKFTEEDNSAIIKNTPDEFIQEPSKDNSNQIATQQSTTKPKSSWFSKLIVKLNKVKDTFGSGLFSIFHGRKIDDALYEEIEDTLLMADLGVETTNKFITELKNIAHRNKLTTGDELYNVIQQVMEEILLAVDTPLTLQENEPTVILVVGVNGVGKTTTIAKLAAKYKKAGKNVLLGACDTFRAAAVEQLIDWGTRLDIPVVSGQENADSASVAYSTMLEAKKTNADVVLLDTAGRLHNKEHLMRELEKISRTVGKLNHNAPHETIIVLDASTGQNAVSQVRIFNEALHLTGIILTKMDGTAKGGIIFSLVNLFKLPIYLIGIGEGSDDLNNFSAKEFIKALFQ